MHFFHISIGIKIHFYFFFYLGISQNRNWRSCLPLTIRGSLRPNNNWRRCTASRGRQTHPWMLTLHSCTLWVSRERESEIVIISMRLLEIVYLTPHLFTHWVNRERVWDCLHLGEINRTSLVELCISQHILVHNGSVESESEIVRNWTSLVKLCISHLISKLTWSAVRD